MKKEEKKKEKKEKKVEPLRYEQKKNWVPGKGQTFKVRWWKKKPIREKKYSLLAQIDKKNKFPKWVRFSTLAREKIKEREKDRKENSCRKCIAIGQIWIKPGKE